MASDDPLARLAATAASVRAHPRTRMIALGVVVLFLLGIAIAIVGAMIRSRDNVQQISSVSASNSVTAEASVIFVHVLGAVTRPGLVELRTGARVVDAIAAAGGFTQDAEPAAVNLARAIKDGEQISVPRLGEVPSGQGTAGSGAAHTGAGGTSGSSNGTSAGLININTADLTQLESLPRIGPALAQRIIDWRESNGGFGSVDDLQQVTGVGEKIFAGLRDLVTV